jgi:hypothetical protein
MLCIEQRAFPKISLGTSPFLGAGQFDNRALMYYSRLFQKPENIVSIIVKSIELGIEAVQAIAYREIVKAILKAVQITGRQVYTSLAIGLDDWREELRYAEELGSDIIYLHARIADSRNIKMMHEITEATRHEGRIPGCATHNPARTIPFLDSADVDIATYLAPVNKIGRFMGKDPDRTLEIITGTPRAVIAKKTLAAGRLAPREALDYFRDLKSIAGIAIGIASVREAEETFPIAKEVFREG